LPSFYSVVAVWIMLCCWHNCFITHVFVTALLCPSGASEDDIMRKLNGNLYSSFRSLDSPVRRSRGIIQLYLSYYPHIHPQIKSAVPAFTALLQSIITFWPVLISHPGEGSRLSWCGSGWQLVQQVRGIFRNDNFNKITKAINKSVYCHRLLVKYHISCPSESRRLSWPGWLVTYCMYVMHFILFSFWCW